MAVRFFHEYIQVTHTSQCSTCGAQSFEMFLDFLGFEELPKNIESRTHPAGCDAHIVEFFDVFAFARAILMAEHVGKLEAKYFPPGFRHGVGGFDPGIFSYTWQRFPPSTWFANNLCFIVTHFSFRKLLWRRG